MNIQEMGTLAQYRLPVKVFILNNQYMGMVRQWQELLHGGRYSESYSAALPDFVKLAEAFHATGLRAKTVDELDDVIRRCWTAPTAVIADIASIQKENCFPMIPSGAAHNEMLLGPMSPPPPPSQRDHRRPGGQRAGRAGPRHRPVLRPRLQHRQPDRGRRSMRSGPARRINARHVGHADGDRADQGAARPAGAGAPRADLTEDGPHVARELALVKVIGTGERGSRRCAWPIRSGPGGGFDAQSFVFEVTGAAEKLDAFIELMRDLGLAEVARTGIAALARGTRVI
jgi:hypothetical protein